MATFNERAAHSVYHVFFVCLLIVVLVISKFGSEEGNLVLIASVPGHCLSLTFDTCIKAFSKANEPL